MGEFLSTMAWPFLACLVLTGIHVYLGVHVIERKVIFVDLALATIAALGAVWGALLGWDVHHDVWVIKGFSLAFTFVGAAVFSLTRMRSERVPHEAIIGITYAVALAAIILGSAKLPHGAEEVRDLQAGSILWIGAETVLQTAALYVVIGAFHFAFRKRFFAISHDPDAAEASGLNVRLWDFLFYVSFGFVVTSSVSIAGVLLVFSYLVIPAVIGVLFADRVAVRLAIGWVVGTLVSALGVTISYHQDLPSGPVIVVCFGTALGLAGVLHYVTASPRPAQALARCLGGVGSVVLLLLGSTALRKDEDVDLVHALEVGTTSERLVALGEVGRHPELWPEVLPVARTLLVEGEVEVRLGLLELITDGHLMALLPEVQALLFDPDDLMREEALECVRHVGLAESVPALRGALEKEQDDYLRVELAEALLEAGDTSGRWALLDVMAGARAVQARRDAFGHLEAHFELELPYDAEASEEERARAVAALRARLEGE